MNEVIVRIKGDHLKVKGGEYVQDIVRCKECKFLLQSECIALHTLVKVDDFCSYGEREGE